MTIKLSLGPCLDLFPSIPDESVDLVVTDPAYESQMKWQGIGTTARMGMGKKGSGSDDLEEKWFPVFPNSDLPDLVQQIYRVLKPGHHAYIFSDWETIKLLHQFAITEGVFPLMNSSGVWVEPFKPVIWDKMMAGTGYSYRNRYEFIIYLWKIDKKGKRRQLADLSIPDVLQFKKPWGKEKKFPTQKPVGLIELLINQSSLPGETVLDPFLGSGTTAVAALRTKREFIGFDISERALALTTANLLDELPPETEDWPTKVFVNPIAPVTETVTQPALLPSLDRKEI